MAQVRPFRAVRYDERRAGPLASLVAPPYDVLDAERVTRYLAAEPAQRRPPHARRRRGGGRARCGRRGSRRASSCARTTRPAGGSRRSTPGRTASHGRARASSVLLRAEPYEAGVVLPHERTHAGPKEGRLRLLRELTGARGADLPALRRAARARRTERACSRWSWRACAARLWRLAGRSSRARSPTRSC